MENQLIPPPAFAPPGVKHLPLAKRIELWSELVEENEALLLASLRARIGPDGDLKAAYRDWQGRRLEEHDRKLVALLENLSRREAQDGR